MKNIIKGVKIKLVVMVSAVLWILVFSQMALSMFGEKSISIKEAFATGDDICAEKCTYEIVSKITNAGVYGENVFENSVEKVVGDIMKNNKCCDYTVGECKKQNKNSVSVEAAGNIEKYIITITMTKLSDTGEIYIHYCIESMGYDSNTPDDCYEKCEEALKVLCELKAQSIIYKRIDAVANGKMSEKMCQKNTDEIYKRLGAKKMSEYYEDEYTSYGYAKKLGNTVVSEGKKINIHVRFEYNELEDKTEVVIATPLIMD